MDEWVGEWMEEWVDGWVGEEAGGRMSGWVNRLMNEHPQEDRPSTLVIGVQKVQMNRTSQ